MRKARKNEVKNKEKNEVKKKGRANRTRMEEMKMHPMESTDKFMRIREKEKTHKHINMITQRRKRNATKRCRSRRRRETTNKKATREWTIERKKQEGKRKSCIGVLSYQAKLEIFEVIIPTRLNILTIWCGIYMIDD